MNGRAARTAAGEGQPWGREGAEREGGREGAQMKLRGSKGWDFGRTRFAVVLPGDQPGASPPGASSVVHPRHLIM